MARQEKDNFAIVEFEEDQSEPHKRLIEVILYAWLTENANQCFCPPSKNWSSELKNRGIPRNNWTKHNCRALKYNIETIKAANVECSLRLNYTTSDTEENEGQQNKRASNSEGISNDYARLFQECEIEELETTSNSEVQSIEFMQNSRLPESVLSDKPTEIETDQAPVSNVVCIQYESYQTILQDIAEVKQSHQLQSDIVSLKMDNINSNLEKISAQNEVMMRMITELCKKSPAELSFVAITDIDDKGKLDELEHKLGEKDYKENMAYQYTQFTSKGDAKKEVNGFAKSILSKLITENFAEQLRWDRIKKLEGTLPAEEDEYIFFKKYKNILDFIVEVCNKNRKDTCSFYNRDKICHAVQDFFKRKSYKKK